MNKKILLLILFLLMAISFIGCESLPEIATPPVEEEVVEDIEDIIDDVSIDEDGEYTKPEDVALYIHMFSKLPSNFITKAKASDLGWESSKGNLWEISDNMSIGGDKFGNREGLLPKADDRNWYECDVNYDGGYRGTERIVYSNDGLIYYTNDHYESFEKLY